MPNHNRDPHRRCTPLVEWPAADQAAWHPAFQKGSLLDGQGPAARWSPKTTRTVIAAYGRYLGFLERKGWLELDAGVPSRVTPDRLRAYLQELQHTVASVTVYGRINNLAQALRIMAPAARFPYLNNARRRLKVRARPSRDKRGRIVPVRALLQLGLELLSRAENGEVGHGIHRAVLYRNGLLILLLACRPIRRDNFADLRVGKELVRRETGYALAVPETQTKSRRPYDRPLDAALTPFIDRYLDHYRPLLLAASSSGYVWISQMRSRLSSSSIGAIVKMHTKAAFGRSISPHLFRDCAMTSLAREEPELVWLGMPLLHHVDPRIAEKHYNQALESDAVEQYQTSMRRLRRKARFYQARKRASRKPEEAG